MNPIRLRSIVPGGVSVLLALALIALASTRAAWAQGGPAAGELELIKGKVKITRQAQTLIVDKAGTLEPVRVGDVVHTGGETRATIRMAASANTVQLYSATYFTVEEAAPQRTAFAMVLGKALFNLVAGGDSRRKFDVRTATATVGVKGTEFYVGTDGDTTYLLTVSGAVGLVNNAFAQREIVAEVGQASAARPREVPTPPVRVPQDAIQRVANEDGLQAFQDLPLRSESERRQGRARDDTRDARDTLKRGTEEIQEAPSSGAGLRYRFGF